MYIYMYIYMYVYIYKYCWKHFLPFLGLFFKEKIDLAARACRNSTIIPRLRQPTSVSLDISKQCLNHGTLMENGMDGIQLVVILVLMV